MRELKQVDGGWELTVEASTVLEDVKVSVNAGLANAATGNDNLKRKLVMVATGWI